LTQPNQEETEMRHALVLATALGGLAFIAPRAHAQSAGLVYVQPIAPQTVQTVQQVLRRDGDYYGGVDGVWGPDSQTALEHYQQRHSLQVTGSLNQATAATMGLDPAALLNVPAPASAPAITGDMLRPHSVQAIQYRLRNYGYYYGPFDGIWGSGTQSALVRFQQGRGMQPDGQPGPQTVAALGLAPDVIAVR
jgi:peptidoglycan hydrolase-like protein with peptidoglycan-binding domain